MKKIFTCIFLLTSFNSTKAQTLAMPNFSFENWSGSVPTNWVDLNGGGSISQTVDHYVGTLAAKGTLVYSNPNTYTPTLVSQSTGFPISMQYTYLRFYYKTNLATGGGGQDKFIAKITTYDAGNNDVGHDIGGGTITVNASSFTEKQVHIYYTGTPVKATITFTVQSGGSDPYAHVGTWFIVDSVSLSNISIGINEIEETSKLQIFPNPAHSNLNFKTEANKAMQFTLSDALGNVVIQRLSSEPVNGYIQESINIESLSSGVYFMMLTSDKKSILRRVMVN
jgi:hypothetical protein